MRYANNAKFIGILRILKNIAIDDDDIIIDNNSNFL